jgi:predicted phage terminase large subunit-like protein
MAIDPALSASDSADFTGFTVVGCAPDATWYIMEADNFKGVPNQVIDRSVRHAIHYKPRKLSLESVAAQILYKNLLIPALREAGLNPEIVEYRIPSYRSKAQRIEALQPLFKMGKIKIREGLEELIEQLTRYPEIEHDDLLDSLTQHLPIVRAPRHGEVHPSIGRDWFEDFKQWAPKDKPKESSDSGDGTYTGQHSTLTWPGKAR